MIVLELDDRDLVRKLRELGSRAEDGRIPLRRLDAAVKANIARAWSKAGAHGASVRGEQWPGFSPQYARADGTEVPAWGGVPRADGRGTVQGRRRPSGQRVTENSKLMQDTGAFQQALLTSRPNISQDRTTLTIGAGLKDYMRHQNDMRRVVKWYPQEDQPLYNRIAEEYLREIVEPFNR